QLRLGFFQQLAHFLDAGCDGIELAKAALSMVGDHVGQGGLAGPRRAVEDHGTEPVRGQEPAEQFPRAQEMFLADELFESPWPHPRRQRLSLLAVGFMDVVKQVDGRLPLKSACAIMAGREGIEKYIVPCLRGNAIVGPCVIRDSLPTTPLAKRRLNDEKKFVALPPPHTPPRNEFLDRPSRQPNTVKM